MPESQLANRQSIRLPNFDYSQSGAYFITACTQDRAKLFGHIKDGIMQLNDIGRKVDQVWHDIPNRFPWVEIDTFQIMPDHIHGIIWIQKRGGRGESHSPGVGEWDDSFAYDDFIKHMPEHTGEWDSPENKGEWDSPLQHHNPQKLPCGTSKTVGSVVRGLKIPVTQWVRQTTDIRDVWQRNYYEEIIRTQQALDNIRRYITNNPMQWQIDLDGGNKLGVWY